MVKINLKINCICFFSDFVITTPLQQSTTWSIPKMYGLNSKLSDNGKLETRSSNNVLSAMPINLALLLLHKQLSNISGLEDTELCLQKRFTVQKGKFLQILHWPKSLCPCYKCNRVGHGQWSFYLWLVLLQLHNKNGDKTNMSNKKIWRSTIKIGYLECATAEQSRGLCDSEHLW